jgi:hypothetical protein
MSPIANSPGEFAVRLSPLPAPIDGYVARTNTGAPLPVSGLSHPGPDGKIARFRPGGKIPHLSMEAASDVARLHAGGRAIKADTAVASTLNRMSIDCRGHVETLAVLAQ